MSKYSDEFGASSFNLDDLLVSNEEVIWRGKPKRFAFIFNTAVTMLPIALLWIAFDSLMIFMISRSGAVDSIGSPLLMILFFVAFFAIHLTPVWIWVKNVLTAEKRWQNTEYALTDRRIIIMTGFLNMNVDSVFYTDISNVSLKYSFFDKILGVGDIYFDLNNATRSFLDLSEAVEIYTMVQKIVMDIQTDIHYPNSYRPESNPGYTTKYIYNGDK